MPSTPQLRKRYLRILRVSYLASIPTHLSHLQSSLLTHRFLQLLLSIYSFHSSFALTSLLSLHLTPTASLAHCSGLVNVDYCQMRDKLLAHYCKAQLYLDKIAVAALQKAFSFIFCASDSGGKGTDWSAKDSTSTQITGTDPLRFQSQKSELSPVFL